MLIYSRAIPEGEQEPLQWPENVVVRAPPFLLFCLQCQPRELRLLYSGTFSATTKFSLDKSRRVLVPRVKPSRSLFRRLRPYPASLRRWKYPSPPGSPWTCPIEIRGNCRWEYRCASGPAMVSCHLVGGPHSQRPHCYFFCYSSVHSLRFGRCIVQTSSGQDDLRRRVGVNPVLPRYHERYSCVWV